MFTYLEEAVKFLTIISWEEFLAIFWPFFLFDCARYLIPNAFMLVKSRWAKAPQEEAFGRHLMSRQPLVSVIIPGFNEASAIGKTVASLQEQTYKNLEILVVDDGSTDGMFKVCQRLAQTEPRLRSFRLDERVGKYSGVNFALNFCRGEYLILIDADCSLHRDAFLEILKKFADPEVGAVSGNLRLRNRQTNIITALQDLEYLITISVGRIIQSWWNILFIVSGGFGAYRQGVLEQFGGCDVTPSEDFDNTIKARKLGWKIGFARKAVCLTDAPTTVFNLIRQRLRWEDTFISITIRKHRNIFNPFEAGFTWSNFLGGLDFIIFDFLFNVIFFFYPFYVYFLFNEYVMVVLVSVYLFYLGYTLLLYLIGLALSDNPKSDLALIWYTPLVPFYYNCLIRPVRLMAHLGELFFRYIYHVPHIPSRVGKGTIHW
jgi:cellulose synthase/poly-beta-1,6-N-acetylglucosamine synthase-like glycosyltransferase